jgi:hypothetical protein
LNECDSHIGLKIFLGQQAYFIPYKKDSVVNNGIDVLDAVLLSDFILEFRDKAKGFILI